MSNDVSEKEEELARLTEQREKDLAELNMFQARFDKDLAEKAAR
jgi:hypothetical protein